MPLPSALPLYHTVKAASVRTGINSGLDFVCCMGDAAGMGGAVRCATQRMACKSIMSSHGEKAGQTIP